MAGRNLFAQATPQPEQPTGRNLFAKPEGGGIMDTLRSVPAAVGKFVMGEHDDYPEIPYGASDLAGNLSKARTTEGKLNMLRGVYEGAELAGEDSYGNPLVSLGQEVQGRPLEQRYYLNKPGASMEDINAFQAAASKAILPAAASAVAGPVTAIPAIATVGAAGATGEALGQGEAAMLGADEGASLPEIGKAGAAAMVGEGAGRALSFAVERAARAFMGQADDAARALIVNGKPTPELQKALADKGMTFDDLTAQARQSLAKVPAAMSADDAATLADFDALGVQPTKGQLSRDFADWQFERETAKETSQAGRSIRARLGDQNRGILQALDDAKAATGGQADDLYDVGRGVKSALVAKNQAMSNEVRAAYKSAREAAGDGPIPFENLVRELDESGDYVGLVPQLDVVKRRLVRYGVLDPDGKVAGGMSVERAELLRREIAGLRGNDPTGQMIMDRVKSALDDDVIAATGENAFAAARQAASERFSEFVNKKTAGIVRKIVDDGVADEDIMKGVVGRWKVADLKRVKNSLNTGNTRQGASAWVDLRAGVIKWLTDEAKMGNAVNEFGDPVISGANIERAIKKIGMPKLRVLFSDEEIAQLNTIRRVANRITSAPPGSINTSGTSAAWWNRLSRATEKLPGGSYLMGALKAAAGGREALKTEARVASTLNPVKTATDQASRAASVATRSARVAPKVGTATAAGVSGSDSTASGTRATGQGARGARTK